MEVAPNASLDESQVWGEVLKKAEKSGGISGRLAKKGIGTTQGDD